MPDGPVPYSASIVSTILLAFMLVAAGCTSVAVGDVTYAEGALEIGVTNAGSAGNAFVQVTVYELRGLHQQQQMVVLEPVVLAQGDNIARVPIALAPGDYKLYIYILKPDERETATIRDIRV